MARVASPRILIGNREWCALPELGIPAIKARVDSGAKTSSLHAFNLQPFRQRGRLWVRFELHPLQKNQRVRVEVEAPVIDQRIVRSSSGEAEQRYVIRTMLQLGDDSWPVEITLANRDSMGYRMLLGREAMRQRLLIDPDAAYLMGRCTARQAAACYARRRAETSQEAPPIPAEMAVPRG